MMHIAHIKICIPTVSGIQQSLVAVIDDLLDAQLAEMCCL